MSRSHFLWPHSIIGSLLTPSSFLQIFTFKLLCHLSLCTISFPEKFSFVSSKTRVYTQPAGPDNFIFKYRCSLLFCVWFCFVFLSSGGMFPNNNIADYFPCFQFFFTYGHYKNAAMSRLLVALTLPDAAHGFFTLSKLSVSIILI